MNNSSALMLARAYDFAALRHSDQRRKGAAAEPYIIHLTEVAALVAEGTAGMDIEIIAAAVLHDTIEDTATSYGELAQVFGERVANMVAEVSDDKSLDAAERKRLQIEHAAHASCGAKIIKLADKTSNLRSLKSSPPTDWTSNRRAEYAIWAGKVVDACRGANPWLEAQFDAARRALND
jgi:(p)ppGpp synthase/HD superfamily hydrolase